MSKFKVGDVVLHRNGATHTLTDYSMRFLDEMPGAWDQYILAPPVATNHAEADRAQREADPIRQRRDDIFRGMCKP